MLIKKIHKLLDTAIKAYEAMTHAHEVGGQANYLCIEAQAQSIKVGQALESEVKKLREENAKLAEEGAALARNAEHFRLSSLKFRTALLQLLAYAELVGSETDEVHQGIVAQARGVLGLGAK